LQQQPRAFFQACPEWAWEAFGQVLGGWRLNGTLLFDLYGGGGFFSRLLAGAYQRSLLVETSALAIADARANLAGMQADIQEADVARWLASQQGSWASPADTVLLDPPRAGLPPAVSQRLAECSAGQIILVGCDGAAFCRDIRRLCEQGRWRLAQLAILDLFPFTPAVECIGLLRREAG
jgi:23S rRNA (uracil1939-C5)-methyltransferase